MQKIINEIKLDFDDVLIKPKRSTLSSRSDVDLTRQFNFPNSTRVLECIPIISANMDTTGSTDMAIELSKHKCLTCLHKHYDPDTIINFFTNNQELHKYTFYSTGISSIDINKLNLVFKTLQQTNISLPNLCIDVANGYTEQFVKTIKQIRKIYPEIIIMAGNVVTPEMTEELIIHGRVDIVKVGIGSGSVCTTRLKTGVGYPQLSAIMECADAAHGLGGHICSDGGCKLVADICKAFGGNTDFVMLGGMLAGTDCCEGEWEYEYRCAIVDNDKKVVKEWWQPNDPGYNPQEKRKKSLRFYGMSSKEAMNKHNGGVAGYRTSEGKCITIPYKGSTEDTIKDILGGLRSSCTYIGASKIKDFGKKTTFVQVNHTHNKVYEK
jgi:GMP reductase